MGNESKESPVSVSVQAVGNIEPFTPEQSFEQWILRFDILLKLNSVKMDPTRVEWLISKGGPYLFGFIYKINQPNPPTNMGYEALCAELKRIIKPKVNIQFARISFMKERKRMASR